MTDWEEAVIGAALKPHPNQQISIINTELDSTHFTNDSNKKIWEALRQLISEGTISLDTTLISARSKIAKNKLDKIVEDTQYQPENLATYTQKLKTIRQIQKSRRQLKEAESLLDQLAATDSNTNAETIEQTILQAVASENPTTPNVIHISEALSAEYDRVEQIKKGNVPPAGLKTGFHALDELTQGFAPGGLVIIAARPSMGKSAFALQIAGNIATVNNVLFFTLEMSTQEVTQRLISVKGKINNTDLRKGMLTTNQLTKLIETQNLLADSQLYITDNSYLTIENIIMQSRSLALQLEARKKKLELIIVDYLQLISTATTQNRNEEIGKITRGLKILAREMNIPIVILSQLNRAVENRPDKHPMLADLRDSGQIEQDADIIMFLYRPSYYNPDYEDEHETEIMVAKNRNGSTGMVALNFIKETVRFTNRERKTEQLY